MATNEKNLFDILIKSHYLLLIDHKLYFKNLGSTNYVLCLYNKRVFYKELTLTDKAKYNRFANHPLQSWEWGEFRKNSGVEVVRIGFFAGNKLIDGLQLTFHPVPYTDYTVGYFPKGKLPTADMLRAVMEIGKKHNAIFIQLEPNVVKSSSFIVRSSSLVPSARPLFTKYTFQLDLTKSEDELMKQMSSKTRYNVRLAQKRGVTIQ